MLARPTDPVPSYARALAAERLDRLAYDLDRARRKGSASAIHDFRVAGRRFLACLSIFSEVFPRKPAERIGAELKEIIKLAGAARDRDIATGLARAAGLAEESDLLAHWATERDRFGAKLRKSLADRKRREISKRWRKRLKLR